MPITVAQLNRLQNFKKHICEVCSCDFYSSRPSKYCSPACKQSAYRSKLLTESPNERVKVIGFKPAIKETPSSNKVLISDDKSLLILQEAEKKLKSITKN